MDPADLLTTAQGRRIAYRQTAGQGPGVVFLGGLRSDMTGTKAMAVQTWAQDTGRALLRFDYSGHGQSDGQFSEGCIGDWLQDAVAALSLTQGPQVLVGSSMGGWIALLLARLMPERIAGLVGIAAAPDFTEDGYWAEFDAEQRATLLRDGQVLLQSEYWDEPTVISRRLIEDGRRNLVLRSPLVLTFPTRFLQGTADIDVRPETALALFDHAEGPDIRLTLVKGADHRFSSPSCLALLLGAIEDVLFAPRQAH